MRGQRIIVVGGVASGPAAALEARRTDEHALITLIEQGKDISYGACEMPMLISGELNSPDRLVRYTAFAFEEKYRIHVRVDHAVDRIDTAVRKLVVRDSVSEKTSELNYDKLILATGAAATIPEGLRASSRDVFVLRTLQDSRTILESLTSRKILHAVVIGSGYIGLDAVWALKERGVRVTLLAPSGLLLSRGLDAEMNVILRRHMQDSGISIRNERATSLDVAPDARIKAVETAKGEKIGCDFVLIATGTSPVTSLGKLAGLKTGKTGGYIVDQAMRTSVPGVWACGDCTERVEMVYGKSIHAPLSLNAFRSGRVAGRNAARSGRGREAVVAPLVLAAGLALGSLEVVHTGWTQAQARDFGKDVVAASIKHRSASSIASHSNVYVRLVVETGSRKLIGGQVIGGRGTSQRINVITALIRAGATVDDLYDVDFVYAPHLAPAHDPLFVAARAVQKLLGTNRR